MLNALQVFVLTGTMAGMSVANAGAAPINCPLFNHKGAFIHASLNCNQASASPAATPDAGTADSSPSVVNCLSSSEAIQSVGGTDSVTTQSSATTGNCQPVMAQTQPFATATPSTATATTRQTDTSPEVSTAASNQGTTGSTGKTAATFAATVSPALSHVLAATTKRLPVTGPSSDIIELCLGLGVLGFVASRIFLLHKLGR